jgi:ribonuclease R
MSRRDSEAISIDGDAVISALKEEPDGLTASQLVDLLDLSSSQRKNLTTFLGRLQSIGIARRSGNTFRWKPSNRILEGSIRQRRRKIINFVADDLKERLKGRIRIPPEETAGAYDGDRVLATVSRSSARDMREGRVELILKRSDLKIVGRLHEGFRDHWVESLDERFPYEIDIDNPGALDEGSVVLVEVTAYPVAGRNPRGHVIELIGASSSEPGVDIQIVILKHDLPHVFPAEVLEEAAAIASEVTADQLEGRLDLRSVPTVTIDGETARDFDDAITLHQTEDGTFDLGVHIADVSYYVRSDTALNQEARLRGTSVYFPERAVPMLPEPLSNGICSLNPRVDRLAMSALMKVDGGGRVIDYKIRETVIRSDERMTYTNVNKLLERKDAVLFERYEPLLPLFGDMERLARILIRMRERRGAIDFDLPESIFEFDDEGRIAGVLRAERNIAHRIIEEFMLLANETVAGHLAQRRIPSIYRIHEEPEPNRVAEFSVLAAGFGHAFPAAEVTSFDYQRLSKQLQGKPEERVLSYAMLRSLQRARYSPENKGHFGLASQVYTHFTSPIRRYPDLIVHRILRESVASAEVPIPRGELELISVESSERERAADNAERELEDWRKAVLMSEHLGEEFEGVISNVREFGCYVELDELFIEGLVPVASLIDDYYRFDERRHSLVGRNRGLTYRLGDRVRVRVDRVNVDRHLVDFSFVKKKKGT